MPLAGTYPSVPPFGNPQIQQGPTYFPSEPTMLGNDELQPSAAAQINVQTNQVDIPYTHVDVLYTQGITKVIVFLLIPESTVYDPYQWYIPDTSTVESTGSTGGSTSSTFPQTGTTTSTTSEPAILGNNETSRNTHLLPLVNNQVYPTSFPPPPPPPDILAYQINSVIYSFMTYNMNDLLRPGFVCCARTLFEEGRKRCIEDPGNYIVKYKYPLSVLAEFLTINFPHQFSKWEYQDIL